MTSAQLKSKIVKFLIAYDISNPRRLARVARCLEKHALRCQKSVFFTERTKAALDQLLDRIAELIDPTNDCVQAWRLSADEPVDGQFRGVVTPIQPRCVVQHENQTYFITENQE